VVKTCYRCGGDVLATGLLIAPARSPLPAQATKCRTLATGDVVTTATMCRGCGAIQIVGDVDNSKRLASDHVAAEQFALAGVE
jgi:hypothetical protein